MQTHGVATVFGVKGTVTHSGFAVAAIPDGAEGEHTATMEEFLDGEGELIGWTKSNERETLEIVLTPKAGAGDDAKKALKYPAIPSKVNLSGFAESAGTDLNVNGDYAYVGGARRTLTPRGRAALRIPLFRPKSSPLTIDQLIALV